MLHVVEPLPELPLPELPLPELPLPELVPLEVPLVPLVPPVEVSQDETALPGWITCGGVIVGVEMGVGVGTGVVTGVPGPDGVNAVGVVGVLDASSTGVVAGEPTEPGPSAPPPGKPP